MCTAEDENWYGCAFCVSSCLSRLYVLHWSCLSGLSDILHYIYVESGRSGVVKGEGN